MGVIATAVKHLIAAGITGEALVGAIAEMEKDLSNQKDEQAERRRAADRERKKRLRNSAESAESADSPFQGSSLSPTPPIPIPNFPPKKNPPKGGQKKGGNLPDRPPYPEYDFLYDDESKQPFRKIGSAGWALTDDWELCQEWFDDALQRGWQAESAKTQAAKFKQHYTGNGPNPPKRKTARNWRMAWINWLDIASGGGQKWAS